MSEYAPDINRPIVCISGGFDPITIGHVRLLKGAAKYGRVIAILNSDEWLIRKKNYRLMEWQDRAEILNALTNVVAVSGVNDDDGTVCEALRRIQPDYFANGGDRVEGNTPEKATCDALGIKMLWAVGGDKVASSQEIIRQAMAAAQPKPWPILNFDKRSYD